MKWTFFIRQKIKVALLMSFVMAIIVVTNLLSRKSIRDADNAIASIYNDRLIPATDLFQITELLHQKRSAIDKILLSTNPGPINYREFTSSDLQIILLIKKFENTYLVNQESEKLKMLKINLADYNKIEAGVIDLIRLGKQEEAKELYYAEAMAFHDQSIKVLIELNKMQSIIGNEIIKNSKFTLDISSLSSSIQIVLAIIIGTCIIKLVAASKLASQTQDKFNLN